ncbi:response regulator [Paenibacillus sp. BSR1-1]|uniref:response regulator transcription factor n=1 Tax=Paenibacillus sp. BSR1-1 TaxID=3020845 RepID=UPI0025B2311B|nr:response regulator [Paenibacillus sp. BSR1-1]MDN3018456.1 response regulator [Paenibacillus sp. BSR1-1]
MINIMLVDDDVPMIKYLRQLINWGEHGLNVVGTSYSSMKALEMFKQYKPDLVISDIGLPQMNGLELASELKQIKPDVRMIFLTCHEDFHYAKKAIELNADSYLIKDELTKEQLEESLKNSIKKIIETSVSLEGLSYKEILNRNIEILKHSLFDRLIKRDEPEMLIQFAKKLDISWQYPSFILGTSQVSLSTFMEKYSYQDLSIIKYGIYNVACDIAKKYHGITIFNEEKSIVFVYNYRQNIKFDHHQYLQSFLKEVQVRIFEFLGLDISFIFGRQSYDIKNVGVVFQKMMCNSYRFFYNKVSILNWDMQTNQSAFCPISRLLDKEMSELVFAVKEKDSNRVKEILTFITQSATEKNLDPEELKKVIARRIRLIELQYIETGNEEFYSLLEECSRLCDAVKLVENKLAQLIQWNGKPNSASSREPKLQEIDQYIIENLSENVTSTDVATHLYMNPSYFSRYFKRLTGENFTDYVHRFKIGVAAKILEQTGESVEEVAIKFGYSDRTYFSKVFKKYTKMTPREYRSKVGY